MVFDKRSAERMYKMARSIAKDKDGEITVLDVVNVPRQTPLSLTHGFGDKGLKAIEEFKREITGSLRNRYLVRLAHDPTEAILQTTEEQDINTLLVDFDFLKNNWTRKKSFEDIITYYQNNNKKTYFYNLYLYDSYGVNDKRSKIISKILKDYKANKKTTILSNRVELNLLNVSEICKAFSLVLKKKINSGNYLIRAKKFTNILDLVKKTNIK